MFLETAKLKLANWVNTQKQFAGARKTSSMTTRPGIGKHGFEWGSAPPRKTV
jgi:hypothetical protein